MGFGARCCGWREYLAGKWEIEKGNFAGECVFTAAEGFCWGLVDIVLLGRGSEIGILDYFRISRIFHHSVFFRVVFCGGWDEKGWFKRFS